MPQLYSFIDYRDLFRAYADEYKTSSGGTYKYVNLAQAMGVQAPYLSKVFRKEAHLSSDQVELGCQEFRLNDDETAYVMLLLEYQRTGLASRREKLKRRIDGFQEEARDTKNHVTGEKVGGDQATIYQEYFLEPLAPLVHVFLAIPEFQAQPEKICRYLALTQRKLREILAKLEGIGMIHYDPAKKRYHFLKDHLHLEKASVLNQAYQLLFRAASAEHVKRLSGEHKNQYSATFGADEETRRAIMDEFNQFMARAEALVRKAPSKGVFQLNFDLFRWDAEEIPLSPEPAVSPEPTSPGRGSQASAGRSKEISRV